MKQAVADSEKTGGRPISHFGPEANEFEKLETLFREYGEKGQGERRLYLHNEEEAAPYNQNQEHLHPGNRSRQDRICCFTKDCMVGRKVKLPMSQNMWIYWLVLCLLLTLSGYKNLS